MTIQPLPLHRQWWVTRTPDGFRAQLQYKPYARAEGPFPTKMSADAVADELNAKEKRIQRTVRVMAIGAGVVVVVLVALILRAVLA